MTEAPVQALEVDGAPTGSGPLETSAAPLQSDSDVRLAAQIRTALIKDDRVASVSDGITVLVRGGMVTLQGRVQTKDQKQAAESDARGVPSVEQVENLLVVPGP